MSCSRRRSCARRRCRRCTRRSTAASSRARWRSSGWRGTGASPTGLPGNAGRRGKAGRSPRRPGGPRSTKPGNRGRPKLQGTPRVSRDHPQPPHKAEGVLPATTVEERTPFSLSSLPSPTGGRRRLYGTLIDWNGGIRGQLARVFGEERADALLVRYHVLEPMLEADGTRSYREVLTEAMRGSAPPTRRRTRWPRRCPTGSRSRKRTTPGWRRGAVAGSWRSSRTPIPTTSRPRRSASAFPSRYVVASEIGSYKPALGHWRASSSGGRLPDVQVAANPSMT